MSHARIPAVSCALRFIDCVKTISPPRLYEPLSWVPGIESSLRRSESGRPAIQSVFVEPVVESCEYPDDSCADAIRAVCPESRGAIVKARLSIRPITSERATCKPLVPPADTTVDKGPLSIVRFLPSPIPDALLPLFRRAWDMSSSSSYSPNRLWADPMHPKAFMYLLVPPPLPLVPQATPSAERDHPVSGS